MRLWSLHPCYLDPVGLVALWREGLLAQKVLAGETRGYRHHPQLIRFRAMPSPLDAIGAYLSQVLNESRRRAYRFDAGRIRRPNAGVQMVVTEGQLRFELRHLRGKLETRSPSRLAELRRIDLPAAHPMFEVIAGEREPWERAS